jgi:hypothetical protein
MKDKKEGSQSSPHRVVLYRNYVWEILLNPFTVEVCIQAFPFLFVGNPKSHRHVENLQDDERGDGTPSDGGYDAFELDPDLSYIAFEGPFGAADGFYCKHAG